MTGAHTAGPTPEPPPTPQSTPQPTPPPTRPKRPLAWRVGTPVVGVVVGALFVISAADSRGTDLRPGRYTDLAGLVEADAADYEKVRQRLESLEDDVDELTEDVSSLSVRRARARFEDLKDPAGLVPRSGPGLSISLSDSPEELLDEAVAHDVRLSQLVVHQQDIQAVVNALWAGGATAVTVAGQRIVSTTGIKCEGPVVQLQGVPYPQPYVIEAVGDPVELSAALDDDPLVTGYRSDAANPYIRIGWEMHVESDIEAPAYDGLLDVRYATPIGGSS
ncbi:hypothetical protein DJ010_12810 [Nocardioides silvaticus]|uniref:DUF881 domain-containing protein n=1 Tax=Nocardioides silvaticus TaxID=2201891 RepID=A0A316TDY1_9ACTN|nr:DUF881 domain-containing protein [Nocardioides silvaticus]PWN02587.1 hypothetical protein DJ010_12810 [Nocardioides silvaticus]